MLPGLIAHLTSVHTPTDVRVVLRECRSLVRTGHNLILIAPDSSPHAIPEVPVCSVPRSRHRFGRLTRTVWSVYREALRRNAQLYHFHDPELLLAGVLLSRHHKVIFDVHEDTPRQILAKDWIPAWIRPAVSAVYARLEHFAVARFSALVTAGEDITSRLAQFNPRVITIGNYPLLEEFADPPSTDLARYSSGAILHCGGITSRSCVEQAVRAMELLPSNVCAVLELAGASSPGSQLTRLQALSGWKRVRHLGLLSRSELVRRLYQASVALVLFAPAPNSAHVRSNKVFEAMAAGLPIVGPDFPAWRTFVATYHCGLVANPTKPAAIAEALSQLLTHPAEAAEMGRCGREAVIEQFNWPREEAKLLQLYEELGATSSANQLAA